MTTARLQMISRALKNSKDDAASFVMIARCHSWADRPDIAEESAKQALSHDPRNFAAIQLLTGILVNRSDHEQAVKYVRLALENFPAPSPPVPGFYIWLARALSRVVPRLNGAENTLRDLDRTNRDWYEWAKSYLAWYDQTHPSDEAQVPTIH